MKKLAILMSVSALAFASPALAAAVYNSGTVQFQYYAYGGAYSGGGSPTNFAAPGSASFFNYFDVAVSGNQIVYTYTGDATWSSSSISLNTGGLLVDNGSVIYSVSGIPSITSVTLNALSQLGSSGFSASNVTWNSGAVAVTWQNQHFAVGNTVILDVNGGAVPEPASWALMITGFGLAGAAMRRRQKVSVTYA
jgi:hypothetical protein